MMYEFHINFPCNLMSNGETPEEAFKNLQEGWKNRVPELQRADIKSIENPDGDEVSFSQNDTKQYRVTTTVNATIVTITLAGSPEKARAKALEPGFNEDLWDAVDLREEDIQVELY